MKFADLYAVEYFTYNWIACIVHALPVFDLSCHLTPCSIFMQVLKLAKKAAKRKQIKRGVKEVIKAIRKNNKGYVNYAAPLIILNLPPLQVIDANFI